MEHGLIAMGAGRERVDLYKARLHELSSIRRNQVDEWPRITLDAFAGKMCGDFLADFETTRADRRSNRRKQILAPRTIRHQSRNHFAGNPRRRAAPSRVHSRNDAPRRIRQQYGNAIGRPNLEPKPRLH